MSTVGADGGLIPGHGEQGTISQSDVSADHGERHLGDNAEGMGESSARGCGHGDTDQRTHVRVYLTQGCCTETNFAVGIGKMPINS
jgi:hypothetical protein